MRLKICEAVNKISGKPIFYLYKDESGEGLLWTLLHGASTLEECRQVAERVRNPVPERVVEEL